MESTANNNQQPEQIVSTANDDSNMSPSATVRTNWLRFSWSQISSASKVILTTLFTISMIQIITTIVILGIGSKAGPINCEKPLQLYLIIFVIRICLSLPLLIHQHLFSNRRRNENSNSNNERSETAVTGETNSSNNEAEQQRTNSSSLISGWIDKLKSLLDLFGILWFIVGNYLIFSNSSCSETASLYYYTILAWIVFGYLILFVPLFACLSVIFCLPCVLVAMRLFNINISNVMKGGTKEEIAKIPVFKYKPPADTKPTMAEDAPSTAKTIITAPNVTIDNQSILSASSSKKKKKISILRRLFRIKFNKKKRSENVASQKNLNYITILKADDAVCSICLGDYEEDELVCKLWCEHYYHKECVYEWLSLNSKCPLCQRDFRGKDHVNSEDSSDEEEY